MSVILVDDREGSKDLYAPLKKLAPAELCRLDYGDVAFEGKGAEGAKVDVGVELKTLGDAVSSIRTGRLTGRQLPGLTGLHAAYDYAFLVVEGEWRINNVGQIVVRTRSGYRPIKTGMTASEFTKKLLTMELCTGLHVVYTHSRQHTVHYLFNLFRWFTDKPMDQHSSHLTPHNRPLGFLKISEFREAVMKWPGVGMQVSKAAESAFEGSVLTAASASVDEWAALATTDKQGRSRRFGLAAAQRVYDFCRGK